MYMNSFSATQTVLAGNSLKKASKKLASVQSQDLGHIEHRGNTLNTSIFILIKYISILQQLV